MAEEHNSSTESEDKADNIDMIFDYVVNNKYGSGVSKNDKSNIRKLSKPYVARKGKLYYRRKVKKDGNSGKEYSEVMVIRDRDEQRRIIKSIHMGSRDDDNITPCLGSHLGINRTRGKLLERYFWKSMGKDVKEFILACDHCQKVNPVHKINRKIDVDHVPKINVGELHPDPVPSEVMDQIGVNITNLPKTEDGYCCIVVAVDYFSKWTEARALKDRTAENVAKFLFEDIICRHGCVKIQINDQGKEFIYKVSSELHRLTGTQQQITSAFHPQANGILKRQNRTIKESFIKSLEDHSNWVECLPAVLFAYRTSKHSSTKMTPFQIIYNRRAVLPIELQLNQITKDYIENHQVKAASSGKPKKKLKEDRQELNRNEPSATKDSFNHGEYGGQLGQDAGQSRNTLIITPLQQDTTDHNAAAAAPFTSHPGALAHPPPHMPPSHPPPSHIFNTPSTNQPPPQEPPPHSQPLSFSMSINSNYSNQNPHYTFPQSYGGRPLLWQCNSQEWNVHKTMN